MKRRNFLAQLLSLGTLLASSPALAFVGRATRKAKRLPAVLTYVGQSSAITADAASFSFTSTNLGTAAADRLIIATIHWSDGSGITLSSGNIAGVAFSIAATQSSFAASTAVVSAVVPTGTSGTVFVQFSGTIERCQVSIWNATGVISTTPYATTQNTTNSATISALPGGFVVAAKSNNAPGAMTWTNATEQYDVALEAGMQISGTSTTSASGTVTISATNDATGQSISAASWR